MLLYIVQQNVDDYVQFSCLTWEGGKKEIAECTDYVQFYEYVWSSLITAHTETTCSETFLLHKTISVCSV